MKKPNILLTLLSLLIVTGCATVGGASYTPVSFPAGEDVYPAVYAAAEEKLSYPVPAEINIFKDTYVYRDIRFMDGLIEKRMDFVVRIDQGTIDLQAVNMQMLEENGRWTDNSALLFFNLPKFKEEFALAMVSASQQTEMHRTNALSDLSYLFVMVRDMTDIAFNRFVEDTMRGKQMSFTGQLLDIEEVNDEIDGETFRYKLTAVDNVETTFDYTDGIYLSWYTNDENMLGLQETDMITAAGVIEGFDRADTGENAFFLSVKDSI